MHHVKRIIEKRRRGAFGWIFLLLFWCWNALAFLSFAGVAAKMSEQRSALTSTHELAGHDLGVAIGTSIFLQQWAIVAALLGLAAFLTRGRKEIIEITTDPNSPPPLPDSKWRLPHGMT